jgi:hypothetical protein
MTAQMVTGALMMAIWRRGPAKGTAASLALSEHCVAITCQAVD